MMNELEGYELILVPEEVSQILRISIGEVYKLLKNGEINAYRVGKTWRIPKPNLQQYIQTKIPVPVKKGNHDKKSCF